MNTEREIDFRYAPHHGQVCIGLVDDAYKTLVWDDGSVCFAYNAADDPYHYFRLQERVQSRALQNRGFRYRFRPAVLHRDDLCLRTQSFGRPEQAIVTTTEEYRHSTVTWTCFAWQKDEQTRVDVILWTLEAAPGFQKTRSGVVLQVLGEELETGRLFATPVLAADGETPAEHLEPGQKMTGAFFIRHSGAFAQQDATVKNARKALQWCEAYWETVRPFRTAFQIPDPQVAAMLTACGRGILQAREIKENVPTYQVGPTCYRGLWIVDGLFLLDAVHMLGRSREAYDGMLAVLRHVHPNGSISAIPYHEKESAIAIYTFVRQCRIMQDEARFRELWPTIQRAFRYLRGRVDESKTLGETYPARGLYPPSYGDGGINGLEPERTTPLWIMAGVQAAAAWGRELGLPDWEAMQGMVNEMMEVYRAAYRRDRRQTTRGAHYAPISMLSDAEMREHIENKALYDRDGEVSNINGYTPQSGTWALAQAIYPGELFAPDDLIVTDFLELLEECDDAEGIPQDTGWMTDDCLWTYGSMFDAQAFLYAGNGKKAADYLYAFANHASPGRCWREEQTLQGRNSDAVWGDMPHNWGAAEFIRLARNLLVMEKNGCLELLTGLPAQWLPSKGEELYLESTPTVFGPVSIRLRREGDSFRLEYRRGDGPAPARVRVHADCVELSDAVEETPGVFVLDGTKKQWSAKIQTCGV